MCTLVAAHRLFTDAPLVIAANRDERLDRPSRRPFLWPGPVPFFAPRDELAGGSWLGLNANGLFVGITNRFGPDLPGTRRSRGLLVTDTLGQDNARTARAMLGSLDARTYSPFNLFYADDTDAFVCWSDGERLEHLVLAPGLHVLTERSFRGVAPARETTVRQRWKATQTDPAKPKLVRLQAMLGEHRPEDPLASPCVHLPDWSYGTRSACILTVGMQGRDDVFLWSEGPPCRVPFSSLAPLPFMRA